MHVALKDAPVARLTGFGLVRLRQFVARLGPLLAQRAGRQRFR